MVATMVALSSSTALCEANTGRFVDQVVVNANGAAMGTVRRLTGEATGLEFRRKNLTAEVCYGDWSLAPPWSANDFKRLDESDDTLFYPEEAPKLVYHIDEGAVAALTNYYKMQIPPKAAVLDICSSWVSHYPIDLQINAVGVGINQRELSNNVQLESYRVIDLNKTPKLPFPDGSFDIVTCVVSVDYLTRPVEVLREAKRVLKPSGKIIISQSNRLFFTKAVKMWLSMSDLDRLELISQYLYYAGFSRSKIEAFDITPVRSSPVAVPSKDPMYVVQATAV